MAKGKKRVVKAEKPEMFIASSTESLRVNHELQAALQHNFTARSWTAGTFQPSQFPLPSLEKELERAKYAVFVFAKDDTIISRGKQSEMVRDNVILELGMFVGRLGSQRCFVVVPKNRGKLKIPSDLEGFTPISYDDELFETSPQVAVTPVATAIERAIKLHSAGSNPNKAESQVTHPTSDPFVKAAEAVALGDAIGDLLEVVARGNAGVAIRVKDRNVLQTWAQSVMKNAMHVLRVVNPAFPSDAYVAWLKPTGQGTSRKLSVFTAENLPGAYNHYPFGLNEGLAGTSWAQGIIGSHTTEKKHPAWKIRHGCENESYLCVPVGAAAGPGGVIAIGSDIGFVPDPRQEAVLKAFAGLLAVAVGSSR